MEIVNLKAPSILISMPYIKDPIFSNSVILILEHNNFGAVGFVVNKPSKLHLGSIFVSADVNMDILKDKPIWTGGPIGVDKGIILHCINDSKLYDEMIDNKIYIASTTKTFLALTEYFKTKEISCDDLMSIDDKKLDNVDKNIIDEHNYLYPLRFILGYCGWGPMQLEGEIKSGYWLQLPLDLDILYNTPYQTMWNNCLSKLSVEPSYITPVENLYLN